MRIMVVDDHPFVSDALAGYLEQIGPEVSDTPINVISAHTLVDAIAKLCGDEPLDIVFLDLKLDEENQGTTTLERFQERNTNNVPVVVFSGLSITDEGAADVVRRCLDELKARSVLLKGTDKASLFIGLKRILLGEEFVPKDVVTLLLKKPSASNGSIDLTPAQWKVAHGVSRGLQNKEIARELGLADAHVRQTVTAIYRRLGIREGKRGENKRVILADYIKREGPPPNPS